MISTHRWRECRSCTTFHHCLTADLLLTVLLVFSFAVPGRLGSFAGSTGFTRRHHQFVAANFRCLAPFLACFDSGTGVYFCVGTFAVE